LIWTIAEFVMKLGHISPEQVIDAAASKRWVDEKLDRSAIFSSGRRLAVLRHVVFEKSVSELSDGNDTFLVVPFSSRVFARRPKA
jgi:hypothetical protein